MGGYSSSLPQLLATATPLQRVEPALPVLPSQTKPLLPITNTPAMHAPPVYREWTVLPIACLTSIATVIGSGILALPVTLYHTQVPVFLILFTISMLAQLAVVYAMVELLQRARAAQTAQQAAQAASENPPRYDTLPHPSPRTDVSLFSIAHLYLPNAWLRAVFHSTTFLCFISIMVSYGLAGPQAVWQLISPGPQQGAPPTVLFVGYWTIGTVAVLFFVDQLLGVFGSFTVLKGALFVGVVLIVALLPDAARVESLQTLFADFSGWSSAVAPFLMSCVALGGVANTTPVTFNLLPAQVTRAQVARYRAAILLAVILCYLLNVGWVLAVLQVVPRTAPEGSASLTVAYEEGQISTVPLIDVLYSGHAVTGPVMEAIEVIVEMFIFVSTGVSFFVIAAGMKSFVDGGADTAMDSFPVLRRPFLAWMPRVIAYIASFGTVLYVIVANPNGFIEVLTRFTSFTVNLQAGALIFVMLYYSRTWLRQGHTAGRGRSNGAGSSNDAVVGIVKAPGPLEMWESPSQPDKESDTDDLESIPLAMPKYMASTWIVFGTIFFTAGCALAALGPMLGIEVGGSE